MHACLAGGVTLLAGCLLTTSLDGLSGTPSQDGGSSVDASSSDSAPPDTVDGGDGAGEARAFCASQSPPPVFCVDFDDGRLDEVFSGLRRTAGDVRIDGASFVSPPSSMISELDVSDGCHYADAYQALPVGLREIHYELSVLFPLQKKDVIFASLEHEAPNREKGCHELVSLGVTDQLNVQRREGSSVIDDLHELTKAIPLGRWTRIAIDVVEKGGVPNVSVRVDGEVALPELALPECGLGGRSGISVGIYCASGKYTARFDDIKVDGR